jgi:AraC family transcriptional regulator
MYPDTVWRSQVSAESYDAKRNIPSRLLVSSENLRWQSVLVRSFADPLVADEFTTAPTPDVTLVRILSGGYEIESLHGRRWQKMEYRPGSIGVAAPGNTDTLRWRGPAVTGTRSLHIFIGRQLLSELADAFGDPSMLSRLPSAMGLDDPIIGAQTQALANALHFGAAPLYADSFAAALAAHLMYGRHMGTRYASRLESGAVDVPAIQRILEFLHDEMAGSPRLDDLAALINVSKFHLLRMFKHHLGVTPYQYLKQVRMEKAEQLLRSTDIPVARICVMCGYLSQAQFSQSFRQHAGVTPAAFRTQMKKS